MKQKFCSVLGMALVFAANSPAAAQFGEAVPSGPGTVTGTGVAVIERMPEIMRMQVALLAKGSNLEKALKDLEDRSQAAKTQLATLRATKESVRMGPPQISSATTGQQRQIEMLMAPRPRGQRGKPAKGQAAATPVTVSAMLVAEWPLEARSVEELLLAAESLEVKIRAADLAGLMEASKLSPEEEEVLEEMESDEYDGYSSGEETKPGEPVFVFVSLVADAERDKALAEAFQKAKDSAARLARAADAELGALRSLSDHYSQLAPEYSEYADNVYDARLYQSGPTHAEQAEAIGVKPGKVTYRVAVTAGFDLKLEK